MKPTQPLDYASSPRVQQRTPASLFWSVYFLGFLIGNVVLQPTVDQLLWGRPGDSVIGMFMNTSAVVVSVVMVVAYLVRLRRCEPAIGMCVAGLAGLLCCAPAYAVLFLFF
jgi:hypothetical protein